MDHNFADVGQHEHDASKAQHMTNEELREAHNDGRLYLDTFRGPKNVVATNFHGNGRYSTATVWVEADDLPNTNREFKAERADLLVSMRNGDTLQ